MQCTKIKHNKASNTEQNSTRDTTEFKCKNKNYEQKKEKDKRNFKLQKKPN